MPCGSTAGFAGRLCIRHAARLFVFDGRKGSFLRVADNPPGANDSATSTTRAFPVKFYRPLFARSQSAVTHVALFSSASFRRQALYTGRKQIRATMSHKVFPKAPMSAGNKD